LDFQARVIILLGFLTELGVALAAAVSSLRVRTRCPDADPPSSSHAQPSLIHKTCDPTEGEHQSVSDFLCKGHENANGVTILCHGKRFNALFSLGGLAFITLKPWDGHSVSNDCGHQRQMMKSVFAKVWLCKFHLMLKCSLTLPSRPQLVMELQLSSC